MNQLKCSRVVEPNVRDSAILSKEKKVHQETEI
jgi:hypothetical protein